MSFLNDKWTVSYLIYGTHQEKHCSNSFMISTWSLIWFAKTHHLGQESRIHPQVHPRVVWPPTCAKQAYQKCSQKKRLFSNNCFSSTFFMGLKGEAFRDSSTRREERLLTFIKTCILGALAFRTVFFGSLFAVLNWWLILKSQAHGYKWPYWGCNISPMKVCSGWKH